MPTVFFIDTAEKTASVVHSFLCFIIVKKWNLFVERNFIHVLDEQSLKSWLVEHGEAPFRAKQIFNWLWERCARNLDEMTNIGKGVRKKMSSSFICSPLSLVKKEESEETIKFLWKLHDGALVESVLICAPGRSTVCVSSQVGCGMRCSFCASGKVGFIRNLEASEIASQVLYINRYLTEKDGGVTHVVYMGMGEPLQNYENVVESIRMLTDRFGISRRRVTVSTVGVIEGIERLSGEGLGINLALSLHAPNQKLRQKLIPYARSVDLGELLFAIEQFREKTGREVTYEYILIQGVNDSTEDAGELASLLHKRGGCVNLIPYNPVEGVRMKRPCKEEIERFRAVLRREGVANTCRYTKGKKISAACGQLALHSFE